MKKNHLTILLSSGILIFLLILSFSLSWLDGAGSNLLARVSSQPIGPSVTIKADFDTYNLGEKITLTWDSSNVSSCVAKGNWKGDKTTKGTEVLSWSATTSGEKRFAIVCESWFGSARDVVTVTVNEASQPELEFSASKATVFVGDELTLTWESKNAKYCEARGSWKGKKSLTGTQLMDWQVNTPGEKRFVLECFSTDKNTSGQIVSTKKNVDVIVYEDGLTPVPPPIIDGEPTLIFSTDSNAVLVGDDLNLRWSSENTNKCTAGGDWSGDKKTVGQQNLRWQTNSTGTKKFHLTCHGEKGEVKESLSIKIVEKADAFVSVKLDEKGEVIPASLFGSNLTYSEEYDIEWSDKDDYKEKLFLLQGGLLRWPGGGVINYTHWNDLLGRGWYDTWNPEFTGDYEPLEEFMDFNEYVDVLKTLEGEAVLGVNIFSGHKYNRVSKAVQDAVDLAREANAKGVDVSYWYLGNENFLPQHRLSIQEYANYINLYTDAIKQVDPDARFVINHLPQWWKKDNPKELRSQWEELLSLVGDKIHAVDVHTYWSRVSQDNIGPTWDHYLSQNQGLIYKGINYQTVLQDFRSLLDGEGYEDIDILVLEWGTGNDDGIEGRYLKRGQVGVVMSEMFMDMIKSQSVAGASYWPTRSLKSRGQEKVYRSLMEPGAEMSPNPVTRYLGLLSKTKQSTLVQTNVSGTNNIRTLASIKKNGDHHIFLLNRSGETKSVSLSLDKNTYNNSLAQITSIHPGYTKGVETLVFDWQSDPNWTIANAKWSDRSLMVTLPPWSLTRVETINK